MMFSYLLLNIGVILFPFILSFDKKVAFYKQWKSVFTAILLTSLIFIPWDILFTINDFWGFNKDYLIGLEFLHLPIEEILFFITVPYAFLFTSACIEAYFPRIVEKVSLRFHIVFISMLTITSIYLVNQYEGIYSISVFIGSPLITIILIFSKHFHFKAFILSFIIILGPFLLVNGLLTGSYTESPIVWYNKDVISNIRIGSIPLEDVFYNYMLCGFLVLFKRPQFYK